MQIQYFLCEYMYPIMYAAYTLHVHVVYMHVYTITYQKIQSDTELVIGICLPCMIDTYGQV